jgi:phage terminase small subunit
VDDIAAARAEVEKHGLLLEEPIVTPRGDTVGVRQVLNPAEMAARRAGALLERLLAALGFSPAARSRLNIF